MRPRLVGINHVALQVDDLEAAVELYCTLFEPTSVDRSEPHAAFLEITGQMRLVDVFDPDGNRIQLAQVLDE